MTYGHDLPSYPFLHYLLPTTLFHLPSTPLSLFHSATSATTFNPVSTPSTAHLSHLSILHTTSSSTTCGKFTRTLHFYAAHSSNIFFWLFPLFPTVYWGRVGEGAVTRVRCLYNFKWFAVCARLFIKPESESRNLSEINEGFKVSAPWQPLTRGEGGKVKSITEVELSYSKTRKKWSTEQNGYFKNKAN